MTGSTDKQSSLESPKVYTVGHSNHTLERFIELLNGAGITAIADVRSVPYSRFNHQFNREALSVDLRSAGIAYSFLGKELGARPNDKKCYREGRANYSLIAATTLFQLGLDRVIEGSRKYRVALMCAEKDPLDCHRTILVGRNLKERGVIINHIYADGHIENGDKAEHRLIKITKQEMDDMFSPSETPSDPLKRAYAIREKEISYAESIGGTREDDEHLAASM